MLFGNFKPDPVLVSFGPFELHWYGLFIATSILVGFFLTLKLFKKYSLSVDKLYDLVFYLVLSSIIGARIWHVVSEWDYYQNNLIDILKIWNGGLAIYGVVIFGFLTLILLARKYKFNFWLLADIFAPMLALGQAFGRWGNYFNNELYGKPTDLPWGISIDILNRLPDYKGFQFYHPIFFYESLLLVIVFLSLIYLHKLRLTHDLKKGTCSLFNGIFFLIYLFSYGLIRFTVSFLRIDPQAEWLALRFDQWTSIFFVILAIILFIILRKKHKICTPKAIK
jgi:phosphatidylglycerol---prolipoprotein diacylglyceryl transferase